MQSQKYVSPMKKILISIILVALMSAQVVVAQGSRSDAQEEHLKGPVSSVLTTTRGSHGQMVGQPYRYAFNKAGDFERTTYYDTMGNPGIVVNYVYDEKGRLLRDVRTREPFSELLLQTTYTVDKKKRTMTIESLGIEDSICDKTVREYDKRGFLTKSITYDEKGAALVAISYVNDDNGNWKEVTYEEGPNFLYSGTDKFRYDTEGNIVELRTYNLNNLRQVLLFDYDFDEYGNWTHCTIYHVSKTSAEVYQNLTREITYFE